MGLVDRVSRVLRSEMNYQSQSADSCNLGAESIFAVGGAVAGASIDKVGILAGGSGYSIGAIPLTGAGALTGFALYEALRSVTNADASSLTAVAVGGVAGAATSSAIGGVGLAVGGAAVSVGMAPMIAAGAITGLSLAGLSRFLQQRIDPEKLLDLVIEEMQAELAQPQRALVTLIATQKRSEQQYAKSQAEANNWKQRAQLALDKGNENLAREALMREKAQVATATTIKTELDSLTTRIEPLKQNLMRLKVAIADAKTTRDLYKAQASMAKAQEPLPYTSACLDPSTTIAAFERMEDKVRQAQARSQSAAERASADLESQFDLLEAADVDLELEAMEAQFLGISAKIQSQLPVVTTLTIQPAANPQDLAADADLEALKAQLEQL